VMLQLLVTPDRKQTHRSRSRRAARSENRAARRWSCTRPSRQTSRASRIPDGHGYGLCDPMRSTSATKNSSRTRERCESVHSGSGKATIRRAGTHRGGRGLASSAAVAFRSSCVGSRSRAAIERRRRAIRALG
jgi:hypothetical protein